MTRADFLNLYETLWELPPGSLKPEDRLEDLAEWDSLAILSTIVILDREFGLSVNGDQIRRCRTFADLMELAHGNLTA